MEFSQLSPMMRQYFAIKEQHKDQLLFFRLGDFYEMFFDDAILCSKELELTLTGKECGLDERAPMCGVPHHSVDVYISRLIKKGYKVAICEQLEDPKTAKGMVKRDVIRVVTPGTILESNLLEEDKNNYIAAVFHQNENCGFVVADISTGKVFATFFQSDFSRYLKDEIAKFTPSEIIYNCPEIVSTELMETVEHLSAASFNRFDTNSDVYDESAVSDQFHLSSYQKNEVEKHPILLHTVQYLFDYLSITQMSGLNRLNILEIYQSGSFMYLDANARRNLEIVETMRNREKRGSLLWVLDKSKTAMGKRLLRQYVEQPLLDLVQINSRLDAVEELKNGPILRVDLQESLTKIYDLERLLTKVMFGSITPRELKALQYGLEQIPTIQGLLSRVESARMQSILNNIDSLSDIVDLIQRSIQEDPPALMKDGGYISDGFDPELDELRSIANNSRGYLTEIEAKEKESTGIKNLRIGYNHVFGYYIEVSKGNLDLVPAHYIRKQTLANGERYITEELKVLEDKILQAHERILVIESSIYHDVIARISEESDRIQKTSNAIAELDVFCSLAQVASENNYCKPIVNQSEEIHILEGRHPVVEKMLHGAPFVTNDAHLNQSDIRVAIITGPNMAGKSTYMRQVALIVLMAQIGSFVPANEARIGIVDGIFTRVGASDDLSAGQSTFMVEMAEVSEILKKATKNSLLILDEIGRGTSTYDGMSIAQSVIEYVSNPSHLGAKTLFATHYHELTALEDSIDCVKNFNIAVKRRGNQIVFLRRIVPGGCDDSYGIDVSKLAGIPDQVINRAYEILKDLEAGITTNARTDIRKDTQQLSLFDNNEILEELQKLDVNTLTPIEALNKLYELKQML